MDNAFITGPERLPPSIPRVAEPWEKALWLVSALLTGAVTMTIELAAIRLYAPYFGYSIYVWGGTIGTLMMTLAAGYAIGGWMADRSRSDLSMFMAILLGGFYQLLVLMSLPVLLFELTRLHPAISPLVATLIAFGPPMTSLAIAGPFVTRFLSRGGSVGTMSGIVCSLTTVGSIIGVFGTTFLLVPYLGTRATLITACAASITIGAAGCIARRPSEWFLLTPLTLLVFTPPPISSEGDLWVRESPYNLVRVTRRQGQVHLILNSESTVQSIRSDLGTWTGYYYDLFALGPLLTPTRRVLVLGLGAGAGVVATRVTAPGAIFDAVEIDPEVVEAGKRFFGLRPDMEHLRVYLADARPWLARSQETYDIIEIDVYNGSPYPPFYLVTEEFFASVRSHLKEDGLVMMNVFDPTRDRTMLNSIAATLARVFPTLKAIPAAGGCHVLFAFPQPRSSGSIRALLQSADQEDLVWMTERIADLVPPPGTQSFTDDHAPVERMAGAIPVGH